MKVQFAPNQKAASPLRLMINPNCPPCRLAFIGLGNLFPARVFYGHHFSFGCVA